MGAGSGAWDLVWREPGSEGWDIWRVVGRQQCPRPVINFDFMLLGQYIALMSHSCELALQLQIVKLRQCCIASKPLNPSLGCILLLVCQFIGGQLPSLLDLTGIQSRG
jgi:hypothetical protein